MKNQKYFSLSLFLVTIFTLTLIGCDTERADASKSKEDYVINFKPALTNGELKTLRENKNVNLIRTLDDFDNLILNYLTPLNKLSINELTEFKNGIVFREGVGVVGLKIQNLNSSLSKEEFTKTMSYFGIDIDNGFWGIHNNVAGKEDYKGYACIEKGTCSKEEKAICLTGC